MTRRYPLAPLFALTGWTMTDVRDLAYAGPKPEGWGEQ